MATSFLLSLASPKRLDLGGSLLEMSERKERDFFSTALPPLREGGVKRHSEVRIEEALFALGNGRDGKSGPLAKARNVRRSWLRQRGVVFRPGFLEVAPESSLPKLEEVKKSVVSGVCASPGIGMERVA